MAQQKLRGLAGTLSGYDSTPFVMVAVIFAAAFGPLAASFWPYMIPFSVTIDEPAAPHSSLAFMFWGADLFVFPLMLIYIAVSLSIFRGKIRPTADLLSVETIMLDSVSASGTRTDNTDIRRRRLLFRCWHRDTQEIDLIFGSFAEASLTGFSTAQLDRFETLLDCSDADLFDWVTGRSTPPPAHNHDVMRLLQSYRHGQKKG